MFSMKSIRSKVTLIVVLILMCLISGGYLGINIYINNLIDKTETDDIDRQEVIIIEDNTPKANEVVNFMLIGADNLDGAGREQSYVQQRSDVFKLVSLDYTAKKIKLTSLDRDLVVWIPDKGGVGEYGHFNWAYSFGGAKYAFDTINYNLDLDVDKYVSFSFAGFIHVIDILGGVDVELSQAEADAFNGIGSTNATMNTYVYAGINHLDGYNALKYCQQRYVDSDFYRMERQNTIIKKVVEKVKDCSYVEMLNLVEECLPYVTTNLSNDEIRKYLFDIISFDLKNIETHTYPSGGSDDVCVNKSSLGGYLINSYVNQVIDLHKFIYGTDDYEPTDTIYELEEDIYATFGDYYEGSGLIP